MKVLMKVSLALLVLSATSAYAAQKKCGVPSSNGGYYSFIDQESGFSVLVVPQNEDTDNNLGNASKTKTELCMSGTLVDASHFFAFKVWPKK